MVKLESLRSGGCEEATFKGIAETMQKISDVLEITENIRNVCFLAHVDHGKTTLSDALISSVGIISEKLSGKLRYLDNRDDEQRRMITIKSSSISLLYSKSELLNENVTGETAKKDKILINLVDSPGHVDFSIEVSTAARLCDGALLIVDVVEGICPQTRAVLKQAWRENVKTALVLNKIDKLILDLHMTPLEAYKRMSNLVEQANALIYQLYMEEVMKKYDTPDMQKSEKWFYSPSEGNVAFCSAIHRWCVYVPEFVCQVGSKLGISQNKLDIVQKSLWGDYYYCTKTKSIKVCKNQEKPMFVQFVLEQVWKVYDAVLSCDVEYIKKVAAHSKAKFSSRQLKLDHLLQTILSNWLPLCGGIFRLIVDSLPSPLTASRKRLKKICPSITNYAKYEQILSLDKEAPVIVHIAKFLGSDLSHMRLTRDVLQGDEKADDFVAFSRVFSGKVSKGDALYICKYLNNNLSPEEMESISELDEPYEDVHIKVRINKVMILMGSELIEVETAHPGNIVALSISTSQSDIAPNKEDYIIWVHADIICRDSDNHTIPIVLTQCVQVKDVMAWLLSLTDPHRKKMYTLEGGYNRNKITRTRTLCSVDRHLTLSNDPELPPFSSPTNEFNNSIIRVSVEPQNFKDMDQLLTGLALLYTADPAVEIDILKTGEYILACCGEVHLERCISDLTNLYAKIPINTSKFRVSIREGIVDLKNNMSSHLLSKKVNFPPWKSMPSEEGQRGSEENLGNESEVVDENYKPEEKANHIQVVPELYITQESVNNGLEYFKISDDFALFLTARQMNSSILEYLDENSREMKGLIYSGEIPSRFEGCTLNESLEQIEKEIYELINTKPTSKQSKSGSKGARMDRNEEGSSAWGDLWAISFSKGSRCLLFYKSKSTIFKNTSQKMLSNVKWSFSESYNRSSIYSQKNGKMISNIISGFELASQSGPLTEEPLRGVVFVIEGIYMREDNLFANNTAASPKQVKQTYAQEKEFAIEDVNLNDLNININKDFNNILNKFTNESDHKKYKLKDCEGERDIRFEARREEREGSVFSGSVETSLRLSDSCTATSSKRSHSMTTWKLMSNMRRLCRKTYMQRGRTRIYEVILRLDLQCDQNVLGKIYNVLQKRRTQILSENVKEGTTTFVIEATMPASESFGLAQDLRSKASGGVIFHLQFSHWEMHPDDPFPETTMTDSELEDDGFNIALLLQSNIPRKIVNDIRKIKGLPTEEKVVAAPEKQRTLSTKK
ncbi:elongation factor 2 [Theileria orientalis strain Shintoku]|uniref:Elongation factor 2 n=1 Tax=Theileria orientalis strain Shintoku TaxID=869250 RepID=J4C7T0_THEOR|nr:elongation factor 2 [Theileria orientalis strain Shintoku]BAM39573.1 elongation factor 2 [Theileria orientalis strain Shintoku]|eukprot:XP_009689874.1 elongation factor 2 [Theileria orientalis strain Shintoku]